MSKHGYLICSNHDFAICLNFLPHNNLLKPQRTSEGLFLHSQKAFVLSLALKPHLLAFELVDDQCTVQV